jgi:hypothetical protein
MTVSCVQARESKYRTIGDEESLVAAGHQVAGFPVRSVTDLCRLVSPRTSQVPPASPASLKRIAIPSKPSGKGVPYLGHGSLALESPADAVVDTLGLAP